MTNCKVRGFSRPFHHRHVRDHQNRMRPQNLHGSDWQFLALLVAGWGMAETVRCLQRRWNLYHAGVLILLDTDLLILAGILILLAVPQLFAAFVMKNYRPPSKVPLPTASFSCSMMRSADQLWIYACEGSPPSTAQGEI